MPFANASVLIKRLLIPSIAFLVTGSALATEVMETSEFSDAALASVGKLHVPGQRFEDGYVRHFDEDCSATLITDDAKSQSSTLIVSAWHCLEFYRDTSRVLTFETAGGETRTANLVASGGSMYSDWALLRLNAPLPYPAVIAVEGKVATDALVMAGYPRRSSGATKVLETVRDCRITGRDDRDITSDCVLQKGASGGAVFLGGPETRYLGVISRGDGESQSIYVPLARFRAKISAHLESGRLP
ncbi:trypsin-like serine peptidase [Congregibacter litoralis]|uniref:Trypsin-like peptidase domain protein n=1 Tax=Congregibacter litoralis KT71 TaxID=314285 RepID=A4A3X4_9GAMM|nr:serine protease [Congregibacter litoralis]EAQ99397.1 Trypsin-like peptidase domain protein [Congregibacter litoralis KT71]